jgi:hypothetical protein
VLVASWDLLLGFNDATTIITLFSVVGLAGAAVYWVRADTQRGEQTEYSGPPPLSLAYKVHRAMEGDATSRAELASILTSVARKASETEESIRSLIESEPALYQYLGDEKAKRKNQTLRFGRKTLPKTEYLSSLVSVIDRVSEVE